MKIIVFLLHIILLVYLLIVGAMQISKHEKIYSNIRSEIMYYYNEDQLKNNINKKVNLHGDWVLEIVSTGESSMIEDKKGAFLLYENYTYSRILKGCPISKRSDRNYRKYAFYKQSSVINKLPMVRSVIIPKFSCELTPQDFLYSLEKGYRSLENAHIKWVQNIQEKSSNKCKLILFDDFRMAAICPVTYAINPERYMNPDMKTVNLLYYFRKN